VASPISVSVVIPTYNRWPLVQRAVEAVLSDPATDEVVVVDDGGSDGSFEQLRRWADRDVRVRPVRIDNVGESGARQAGVEHAGGEVVVLLDDDVVARPALITGHRRHHAARRGLVVLGYMPTRLPTRRRPGQVTTFLYAEAYERRVVTYADPANVLRHLWAGNFSLSRADCLRIGLRDPRYPALYHQDRNFGLRCLDAGLEGVFDRSLVADHLHMRSLDAFRSDCRRQGAGLRLVHELHADRIGPFDESTLVDDLSPAVAAVVTAAARPRWHPAAAFVLSTAVRAAGRAHAWRAETALAKVLRRVERRYGAEVGGSVVLGGAP
jgi:glycosyltransferase involved in cell wall biosynthesis